jgi:uncharacterized membrane protein
MTQDRFDRVAAIVLAVGVAVSAALVALGFLASFVAGWTGSLLGVPVPDSATTDFSHLVPRLAVLQPLAIVQLGLILLVATPIVRVIATAVGFWREHDRLYLGLSILVLVLLALSFALLR